MPVIYLAGSLFNAGERLHNLMLEKELVAWGHSVVLPQREAGKFVDSQGKANVQAIAEDCRRACSEQGVIYVGCADGADVDSGTCVELGLALAKNGRAVIYRTDFRTALEKEVGVNAMLQLEGVEFIYLPCFYTELSEVEEFYKKLARIIHHTIDEMEAWAQLAEKVREKRNQP